MVMGVFAEIRNGFECFCKCNIFVFQIWVKKNYVVFWYLGMYVFSTKHAKSQQQQKNEKNKQYEKNGNKRGRVPPGGEMYSVKK